MKILELCESERPREKMLSRGPGALGNAELLAIILRTGTRTGSKSSPSVESAIDVANNLLRKAGGSLQELSRMSTAQLSTVPGVKGIKALSVMAALELGRRFMAEASPVSKRPLTCSRMVYDIMIPRLKGLSHEECWVMTLNAAHYVTGTVQMSKGGGTSTIIDVRGILKTALDERATAIILIHNHPSGNPRPGKADVSETEALRKAAESVSIPMLDHVIVCDDCYFSFAEERTVRVQGD